jgi:N-acetylglucosaminyldiphosphoundecaprenol N-acetyl-beta-D-mannosaminyltransferase
MVKRYQILRIWTDSVTKQEAIQKLDQYIQNDSKLHTIFSANPEKNYSVPADPLLYKKYKESDLLLPDGIGVVVAARILHNIKIQRLPGCEFMQQTCAHAQKQGYKIFIYGAKNNVLLGAIKELRYRYPDLHIVGHCHGYWPDENMAQLISLINKSQAQILFLALGSPKQEQWIEKYGDKLNTVKVCECIGGTLDVINGNVKRAPKIFCRYGLEWLYRLIKEPRRISRQWVLPLFALQIFSVKLKSVLSGKPLT